MKVRFAPSPTGRLHLGNARTALVNWLHARKAAGVFLLRLDDTDRERSTAAHAEAIARDLVWLGLTWDEFVRQSDRMERYEAAISRLKATGRLYPCYESEEELAAKRAAARAAGRPPVYDRQALQLEEAARARLEAVGRRPYWRFLLKGRQARWDDGIRGPQQLPLAQQSDPVLVRADGLPLYTLSSVVDDIELGVTDVIRGEDHVTNTAVQLELFAALESAPPRFAHLPLIHFAEGGPLSKREGSLSLENLRAQGFEPMALNSLLARIGTPDPVEPMTRLEDLMERFDLGRFGRASPRLDAGRLEEINRQVLQRLPYETVAPWLREEGLTAIDEAVWEGLRGNLARRRDIAYWQDVLAGEIAPLREAPDYLAEAAELLPPEPWEAEGGALWQRWTGAIQAQTGRRGRELFHPLRLALTGREEGPDLKLLLPRMGRARTLRRLRAEMAA